MAKGIMVQPFSTNFQRGVASAKRLSGRFDPTLKVWVLPIGTSIDGQTLGEMQNSGTLKDVLKGFHLKPIIESTGDAAVSYQGQRSMDDPDSIF